MIQLVTTEMDGRTRTVTAADGVTLEYVLGAMEAAVYDGTATYAAVLVDGQIYAEIET